MSVVKLGDITFCYPGVQSHSMVFLHMGRQQERRSGRTEKQGGAAILEQKDPLG